MAPDIKAYFMPGTRVTHEPKNRDEGLAIFADEKQVKAEYPPSLRLKHRPHIPRAQSARSRSNEQSQESTAQASDASRLDGSSNTKMAVADPTRNPGMHGVSTGDTMSLSPGEKSHTHRARSALTNDPATSRWRQAVREPLPDTDGRSANDQSVAGRVSRLMSRDSATKQGRITSANNASTTGRNRANEGPSISQLKAFRPARSVGPDTPRSKEAAKPQKGLAYLGMNQRALVQDNNAIGKLQQAVQALRAKTKAPTPQEGVATPSDSKSKNPPAVTQQVIIIKQSSSSYKLPSAFWERSYLGRIGMRRFK